MGHPGPTTRLSPENAKSRNVETSIFGRLNFFSMPDEPLVTHSIVEAYLYLMATPCGSCGQGPLEGGKARSVDGRDKGMTLAIDVTCGACRSVKTLTFHLPEALETDKQQASSAINPTDEASRILDVGRWIVLFRMITEEAGREADKVRVRSLGMEGAQCLDEALKFYDDVGNDLPPPEAFSCETSRVRFRESPEQFSKQRLLALRAKLPQAYPARPHTSVPKKKPWWRPRR